MSEPTEEANVRAFRLRLAKAFEDDVSIAEVEELLARFRAEARQEESARAFSLLMRGHEGYCLRCFTAAAQVVTAEAPLSSPPVEESR